MSAPQEPRGGEGLKPCPFECGRTPPAVSSWMLGTADELQMKTDQWSFAVRCICGVQGPERSCEADAIAAWNRRPTAPSASGGEAVAWERRRTVGSNLGWVPVDPEDIPHYQSVGQEIRPLFAHPARMPTREEWLDVSPELAAEFANIDGPWTRGQMDMVEVWQALMNAQYEALFHTGETTGDGRG